MVAQCERRGDAPHPRLQRGHVLDRVPPAQEELARPALVARDPVDHLRLERTPVAHRHLHARTGALLVADAERQGLYLRAPVRVGERLLRSGREQAVRPAEIPVELHVERRGEPRVVEPRLVLPHARRVREDSLAQDREPGPPREMRRSLDHRRVRGRPLDPGAGHAIRREMAVGKIHAHVVEKHRAAVSHEREPHRVPRFATCAVARLRLEVCAVAVDPHGLDGGDLVAEARGERHEEGGRAEPRRRRDRDPSC